VKIDEREIQRQREKAERIEKEKDRKGERQRE